MNPYPSWNVLRPPALDIARTKYGVFGSQLPLDSALAAGALSPDVQPNSPPCFAAPPQSSPLVQPPSLLKIGNYVLTERLTDMTPGVAVYKTVHVSTNENYVCRVLPMNRSQATIAPYFAVGPHPHIAGIDEVIAGSTSTYVMRRVADATEDLHAYIRRRRRLTEFEASRLFLQALDAVAHCHRHGVIVRDIKLRRFVFTDVHRTTLQLDGLHDAVVFTGSDDRLTDKHGCLAYVSPEILDATFTGATETTASSPSSRTTGSSYAGCAADMWSLGVMLFTMLVGRYPFADTDACVLFARIRRGRYPLPSEVALSSSARCLIRNLLAVNPADRMTADEALQHPWFTTALAGGFEPDASFFPLAGAASSADDRAVPDMASDVVEDFFGE